MIKMMTLTTTWSGPVWGSSRRGGGGRARLARRSPRAAPLYPSWTPRRATAAARNEAGGGGGGGAGLVAAAAAVGDHGMVDVRFVVLSLSCLLCWHNILF